ncbi:hypothetical protein ZIOFF_022943 [Zingiber officinale]|uniref:Plant heme peroxidase family profile domain-containing protein n=1 Tax=Zingiber officinale TaxID=94328 RepID=A0A8J5HA65_ZINOF|nr:hypothetical protein ZIOFF_022943 [Zingiber officinale]
MDGATWMKGWKDNQFHGRSKPPSPFDSITILQQKFANVGLNDTDLVALSDGGNRSVLSNFDLDTPDQFDNKYYTNLKNLNGLLTTDQDLLSAAGTSASTAPDVNRFAADQNVFFESFIEGMIKMGNIKVLTGDSGEVRSNCRVVNGAIRLRGRR